MGPQNLFTASVVDEESQVYGKDKEALRIWGIMHRSDHVPDISELLTLFNVQEPDTIHIGRINRKIPSKLIESEDWTNPDFLEFNADQQVGASQFGSFIVDRSLFIE